MRLWKIPAAALLALSAFGRPSPSSANSGRRPRPPRPSRGAPGPVAGAGLPVAIAAGAYWLIRRRMSRAGDTQDK